MPLVANALPYIYGQLSCGSLGVHLETHFPASVSPQPPQGAGPLSVRWRRGKGGGLSGLDFSLAMHGGFIIQSMVAGGGLLSGGGGGGGAGGGETGAAVEVNPVASGVVVVVMMVVAAAVAVERQWQLSGPAATSGLLWRMLPELSHLPEMYPLHTLCARRPWASGMHLPAITRTCCSPVAGDCLHTFIRQASTEPYETTRA